MDKETWEAFFREILDLLAAGRQDEAMARVMAQKQLLNLPADVQDKERIACIGYHYQTYLNYQKHIEFLEEYYGKILERVAELERTLRHWRYRFLPLGRRKLTEELNEKRAVWAQFQEEICSPSAPPEWEAFQQAHEYFAEIFPFEGTKADEIASVSKMSKPDEPS